MKKFLTSLLLLISPLTYLLSQCEVYITPGTSIANDHNPGISFGFEIQNDSDVPYTGGTLGINFLLCSDDNIWEFELTTAGIIPPGGSGYVATPILDVPLPENAQDWYCYDNPDNPDNYFPWYLYLDGEAQVNGEYCWDAVTDPTQPNGYFNNPLSEGCDNPDGDIFCNDGCNVELVDFNLETNELTIIPYSTYCPNNNSPSFQNQYPFDDPHIFAFSLYFLAGGQGFSVSVSNQDIYSSDEPLVLTLNSGAVNGIVNTLLEGIENNDYCDITLTLYNINNVGQPLWLANDNQTIELLDLCPPLDIIDLSVDTVLYTYGCDSLPYWSPEIHLTNQGNTPITEWCLKFDILGQNNDTICFNTPTIMPGETYVQQWPNVYDWGTLSLHALHINGENDNWWSDFGNDNVISNNMYSEAIIYNDECDVTELTYVNAECNVNCDVNGAYWYVTTTWTNTGNVEITNFCATWDVIGGQGDVQECYNGSLIPGDSVLLSFGPFTENGTPVAWAYLQIINGEILNPQIENYETLYCYEDAQLSCVYGCIDPVANNYDPNADIDNGSCIYDVFGCTDINALNYNPLANIDDGSCEYNIFGCTDSEAVNYNPLATINDGSCIFPPEPCEGLYYAPNVFTPNNDGANDGWVVEVDNPDCWKSWYVAIYNRWGSLVWESSTIGEVWSANMFGGDYYVADGVYVYLVRGEGWDPSHTFETTGHITVFR